MKEKKSPLLKTAIVCEMFEICGNKADGFTKDDVPICKECYQKKLATKNTREKEEGSENNDY